MASTSRKRKTLDPDTQLAEFLDSMDLDDEEVIIVNANNDVDGTSALVLMRRVLEEELAYNNISNHKLIMLAVHAVLLDSGFVGFNPFTNRVIDGFHFCGTSWPSIFHLSQVSLFYTLPEIVTNVHSDTYTIVLKFQTFGGIITDVCGSLSTCRPEKITEHSLQLNENQIVLILTEYMNVNSAEQEVLKFLWNLKNNLALPLLRDIYEKIGFMGLPNDLKLKILETLSGVDVARVSCVCSELRDLASSDHLWKLKFKEQFDATNSVLQHVRGWKENFAETWTWNKEIRGKKRLNKNSRRMY